MWQHIFHDSDGIILVDNTAPINEEFTIELCLRKRN